MTAADVAGQSPPHDLDAEQGVLGAVLLAPSALDVVRLAGLATDRFYRPRNALIFGAMVALADRDAAVDAVTVCGELDAAGKLEEAGGAAYVHSLPTMVASPGAAADYARRIVGLGGYRAQQAAGRALADAAGRQDAEGVAAARRTLDDATAGQDVQADRVASGGSYLLDVPARTEAIWGRGDEVLWSPGEGLMIAAPQGVGKTTVAGQLMRARIGLGDGSLLGYPVAVVERPVLYIAADRPEQARRSMARMVDQGDRELLDQRLLIWPGPPPVNVVADPSSLARWVTGLGAGTIIIDSYKDIAVGLAEDAVGAAVNQAVQHLLAGGIEVVVLHHQRKSQDGRKPSKLDDVYGSTWLTAGMGSVVLLWGDPGDSYVEMTHLKQPVSEVGPLTIHHDHEAGVSTIPEAVDLLDLAVMGVTVADAARTIYDEANPSRNQIERARRRLDSLVDRGDLRREPGASEKAPAIYHAVDRDALASETVIGRDRQSAITAGITADHEAALQSITRPITADHGSGERHPAPIRGAGGVIGAAGPYDDVQVGVER